MNPWIPKAHYSEQWDKPFPLQVKPLNVNSKLNWRIFIFCTLGTNRLKQCFECSRWFLLLLCTMLQWISNTSVLPEVTYNYNIHDKISSINCTTTTNLIFLHQQNWLLGIIKKVSQSWALLAFQYFYSRGYTSGTWNASVKKQLRNFGSSSFSVSLNNERKVSLLGQIW